MKNNANNVNFEDINVKFKVNNFKFKLSWKRFRSWLVKDNDMMTETLKLEAKRSLLNSKSWWYYMWQKWEKVNLHFKVNWEKTIVALAQESFIYVLVSGLFIMTESFL